MAKTASERFIPFLAGHEGLVLKAYRDAGGVVTIGYGFTNRSAVFSAFWKKKHGRSMRMGDRMTRADADLMLAKTVAAEYAPPVDRRFPDGILQHQFDGATSVSFNCGPGSLKWSWAGLLAGGKISAAASKLRVTAVTAGGRRLRGLVNRRADEARLIEHGDYGRWGAGKSETGNPAAVSDTPEELAPFWKILHAKGFIDLSPTADKAAIKAWQSQHGLTPDGDVGPNTLKAAVKRFQAKHDLTVDGIVGPATRAALIRVSEGSAAKKVGGVASVGGAGAGGAASPAEGFDPATLIPIGVGVAIAVVVVIVGLKLWQNRGRILGRRTPA